MPKHEAFADWILIREKLACKPLIDHRHQRRIFSVGFSEAAATQQRDSKRRHIAGADDVNIGMWIIARPGLGHAFNRYVVTAVAVSHWGIRGHRCAFHARQFAHA